MITKIAKKFEETSFYEVSSYGKIPLTLAASIALSLGVSNVANAAAISPISYDMLNGNGQAIGGSFNYWDKNYTGSGNTNQDNAPLSGGLGDLTDGVIATDNWLNVENVAGEGPYVGWLSLDPTITFNYANIVNIDSVTIYVDDYNGVGAGNVRVPHSVNLSMGGASFSSGTLVDPPSSAPTSLLFIFIKIKPS